ncbi:MAG: UDP-4-amino-4,6-dideoxy-N-acetyl-beta-L-altrosamine transaminase [Myxococcales bacterium]|nr:UDP-4-amino-4,6-dideoxy-N-acetyl-beta-L-altrosamine transaminase [Myxococcales bacterium]
MSGPIIPYGRQWIDEDDIAAVTRVLRSGYLTTGPEVEAFEADLASVCGAKHAVVVANGTAALHCAYAAAGLAAGDEVVTTPMTFSATSNMVLALGARPVFADVLASTLGLDPAKAEQAITARTKVISAVDFAGHPAAMDQFMALAKQRGLLVVEDASHSIGGRFQGRPVGSLAHLTTFSFHPVKTITTGEGGAVLTDDDTLAEKARDFRNHGLVRDAARMERRDGPWYYEVQSVGLNYRLSDLQCALGRSQLKKLPQFAKRRGEIVARWRAALRDVPSLTLLVDQPGAEPVWHLMTVQVRGGQRARATFFAALQQRGIAPQVHYIAVNDLPLYRGLGYDPAATPIAFAASHSLCSLPLYPALSDEELDRAIRAVHEAAHEAAREAAAEASGRG